MKQSSPDSIVDTWRLNHRVNLMLIEHISDAGMRSTLSTRGGRDVARQFGHMHDVRLMQLDVVGKDLLTGLMKFSTKDDRKSSPTKAALAMAMSASTEAIALLLSRALDDGGTIKNYTRGPTTLVGYFLAHEAHHRGSILLTLKQTGHKVPTDVQYGIWDWTKI